MARSGDLPITGMPNSSRKKRDRKGNVVQRRLRSGGDGKVILNIDYDHDHGAGRPHAHDWDWTQDPPVRSPGRALKQKKTKGKK